MCLAVDSNHPPSSGRAPAKTIQLSAVVPSAYDEAGFGIPWFPRMVMARLLPDSPRPSAHLARNRGPMGQVSPAVFLPY